LRGGRVGGFTRITTTEGLAALAVVRGASAAGVTNDRVLLGGDATLFL